MDGAQLHWAGQLDVNRLNMEKKRLVVVNFWVDRTGNSPDGPSPPQTPAAHGWTLDNRTPYQSIPRRAGLAVLHCDLYRWLPPKKGEPMQKPQF